MWYNIGDEKKEDEKKEGKKLKGGKPWSKKKK
jgi:hypothetical protein